MRILHVCDVGQITPSLDPVCACGVLAGTLEDVPAFACQSWFPAPLPGRTTDFSFHPGTARSRMGRLSHSARLPLILSLALPGLKYFSCLASGKVIGGLVVLRLRRVFRVQPLGWWEGQVGGAGGRAARLNSELACRSGRPHRGRLQRCDMMLSSGPYAWIIGRRDRPPRNRRNRDDGRPAH